MNNTEVEDLKYFIPISNFEICLIDGTTKEQIIKLYPTRINGAYYLNKFANYLLFNYKLSLKDYCKQYLKFNWPICPSKGKETGYKIYGAGLKISRYNLGGVNKENCENFVKGCKKLSEARAGSGNPMFGKGAWNKGLDRTDPRVNYVASLREGSKTSEETKIKQSNSAKKRLIHGHTGKKHPKETCEKLRQITANRLKNKKFHRESSIHIKMREFLKELDLSFEEEFLLKYYSIDFAFPEKKIGIECQGTFFHVDPRIYPNGPICATQRRNFGRDKAKKTFSQNLGWKLIEVWETEINDGTFKEILKCKLKELNLLKV